MPTRKACKMALFLKKVEPWSKSWPNLKKEAVVLKIKANLTFWPELKQAQRGVN